MDAQVIHRAAAILGLEIFLTPELGEGTFDVQDPVPMANGYNAVYSWCNPALAHTLIFRLIERLNEADVTVEITLWQEATGLELCSTHIPTHMKVRNCDVDSSEQGDYATLLTTLCDAVETIND